jgi:hypothetical protein
MTTPISSFDLSPSPESPSRTYWDRVVEVYKARLTVAAALVLATVTITGYAIQSQRPELFLLATAMPPVILAFDLIAKWFVLTPFLYRALIADLRSADDEPITLLFLEFATAKSFYRDLLRLTDPVVRQASFRKRYTSRHLFVRLVFVLGVSFVELFLWYLGSSAA